jgi:hypothetical protein
MIKRFLNVCTILVFIGVVIALFNTASQTSTRTIEWIINSIGTGLFFLALIATINYIFFGKISIFHKANKQ